MQPYSVEKNRSHQAQIYMVSLLYSIIKVFFGSVQPFPCIIAFNLFCISCLLWEKQSFFLNSRPLNKILSEADVKMLFLLSIVLEQALVWSTLPSPAFLWCREIRPHQVLIKRDFEIKFNSLFNSASNSKANIRKTKT